MKSLEFKKYELIKEEIKKVKEKEVEEWVRYRENGGEGGSENYKKWTLTNPHSLKLTELNKELASLSWVEKEMEKEEEKRIEKEEAEELELAKNEFWITTPNYNSLNWGSKKVKLNWVDENGIEFEHETKLNDKVVKLGDNWFKMVKLNSLPNWLERERDELITFLYLPAKKSQEQIASLQFKKVGSWELVKELKIAPKWINSSKIRWLVESGNN